jgi:hypothetical protein
VTCWEAFTERAVRSCLADVREFDAKYIKTRRGARAGGFTSEVAERVYQGITKGVWRLKGESLAPARRRRASPGLEPKVGRARVGSRLGRPLGAALDVADAYFRMLGKHEHDTVEKELRNNPNAVIQTGDRTYILGNPNSI